MHLDRTVIFLCLMLVLAMPRRAAAGDTWSTPYTGVRYLYRTTSTPWRIHALVVDLCAPGVSLRATQSSERKRKTSSFGTLVGAEAAVNADFFSFSSYGTSGLAMGNGQRWGDTSDNSYSGFLAFGQDRARLDAPNSTMSTPEPWMQQVVSGHPHILVGGAVVSTYTASVCTGNVRHPRTAAGMSKDGRTLYLAVVDGRWSASVGMSCKELGQLMAGLGAWNAVNLDGGGSSTMWLRSKGIVNHPSDGTERTVANHLAVHATGTGPATSCDYTLDELLYQAAENGGGARSTDIDGDGKADACARSSSELRCNLEASSSGSRVVLGPKLSDAAGWTDPANYSTLRLGDVNGDGKADVCGREDTGVRCWLSSGTGFATSIAGPPLTDASGWGVSKYYTSLRLADVNGDGRDDICARGSAGVQCHLATGSGFGGAIAGPRLSDKDGWDQPRYGGTIRMGDLDGDGKDDLCARASSGMQCWRSTGSGFSSTAISGPTWSDSGGWDKLRHYSTIRMLDLNGDGRADLCAKSATTFNCHLSTGSGFGAAVAGPSMTDTGGWWAYKYFSTIRLADITGDGKADLCARSSSGVHCWPWAGSGFAAAAVTGPPLTDAVGWGSEKYFRSIRLADISGDRKADLCARGSAGVTCWLSNGSGFPTSLPGPAWASSVGWDAPEHDTTIRLGGPSCYPGPEVCDGKDNDCDGRIDEDGACARDTGPVRPDAGPARDGLVQRDLAVPRDGPAARDGGGKRDGTAKRDGQARRDGAPGHDGSPTSSELAGGCGCQATPAATAGPWALLLVALGLRRRRRPWSGERGSEGSRPPE